MEPLGFSLIELYNFIVEATDGTYASGKPPEQIVERSGHIEYKYESGKFLYRDSYTGNVRSQGSEYVILKSTGKVIWENGYGGGMEEGRESLSENCFNFLKKAMLNKNTIQQSFRGPAMFRDIEFPDWYYRYTQQGDIERYEGLEEIFYKGDRVFFHQVNGGIVRG